MGTRIVITGASGFVGNYLQTYFENSKNEYSIYKYNRNEVRHDINKSYGIIHLAGKAHDIKKVSKSNEYYIANTELTKSIYDEFLQSDGKIFITLSSIKAVADAAEEEIDESNVANPVTHYGKSKLLAEQYILSKKLSEGKRVYILRPCMIHGPGNKGNLNLLYQIVLKGFPWPLGKFENKRSFCSVENLAFIIEELILRNDIPSGIYNVADDIPLSTNEIIRLIGNAIGREPKIMFINKAVIKIIARIGDFLKLPLNSERLQKLTESFLVSNIKIRKAIGKPLPTSSTDGLLNTIKSFKV